MVLSYLETVFGGIKIIKNRLIYIYNGIIYMNKIK